VVAAGAGGGPHVKLFADGGAGNDALLNSFENVTLELVLQGGDGNDNVEADGSVRPVTDGTSSTIFLDGGAGNDLLSLKINRAGDRENGQLLVDAWVDGGDGLDRAFVTRGIKVTNVEKVVLLDDPTGSPPILIE
jgi:hypothetical protein